MAAILLCSGLVSFLLLLLWIASAVAMSGIAGLERLSYRMGEGGEKLLGYGLLILPPLVLLHRCMAPPTPSTDRHQDNSHSSNDTNALHTRKHLGAKDKVTRVIAEQA